jgi:predicted nucleotidyltransferase component of viral defense system
MNLSVEALADLATETGYRVDTLEKVIRLGELLADIERHPLLSEVLVLKGGTALNLFPGPPSRISVDLDFNYVGHADRQRMLQQRPDVERAVQVIARGQRYTVQNSREGHAGKKFYLSYWATTGTQDRIELDLNYLFRIPLGRIRRSVMWQPDKLEQPRGRLVAEEELLAGKLCALLDRVAPRDLFDIV